MVDLAVEEVRAMGLSLVVLAELWVVPGLDSRVQRLLPEAARPVRLRSPAALQPSGFSTREATR
jgi:hypothetical protein